MASEWERERPEEGWEGWRNGMLDNTRELGRGKLLKDLKQNTSPEEE